MSTVKVVVLAAGKGKRLQSEQYNLPKVLREANGKPLLHYVLEALDFLPKGDTILVVGYMGDKVVDRFPGYPVAVQEPQNGTGHAVQCAQEYLQDFNGPVLVCCGDMPLLEKDSYRKLLEVHQREHNTCTFLSGTSAVDLHCGRVVRDEHGRFAGIVEDKDCDVETAKIREYNAAVYVFDCKILLSCLSQLKNDNAQGEYYLTDVPLLILAQHGTVGICNLADGEQIIGVNTPEQLQMVENRLKSRQASKM